MNEKVLIIEDERDIAKIIDYNLKREGYKTILTHDGLAGVNLAEKERPNIIILDLMLPGMDGLEVCRRLRKNPKTSGVIIIMLTAKSEETDKVVGLEMGADDYVTKPFSIRELMARMKAVTRRLSEKQGTSDIYESGNLRIDFAKISVTVKSKRVDLTSKEFELLKSLIKVNGRVVSRENLLEMVWGYATAADVLTRTVDVHIMTLRKKLKTEGGRILTVKNYGYRFLEDEKDA
jgi:two-component system alkaline phosphatase synthesis response regulator PhoP